MSVLRILWLKDGKAGHMNKARGLIRALGEVQSVEVSEYELEWRFPLFRALLSGVFARSFFLPIGCFYRNLPSLRQYDLVLSAGGATQWLNAAIAHQNKIDNVFLGSSRRIPGNAFSLIASHDAPLNQPPFFRFGLIPSHVTHVAATEAAIAAGLEPSSSWGLVIGGDGEGMHWSREDYLELVKVICSQASDARVELWIATSRRTPAEVESAILDFAHGSGVLAGACLVHRPTQDEVSLLAMMGACSRICVTADSMSMTHESVSSGSPVLVAFPDSASGNARLLGNLSRLESLRYVVCRRVSEVSLGDAEPDGGWSLVQDDPSSELAHAVLSVVSS